MTESADQGFMVTMPAKVSVGIVIAFLMQVGVFVWQANTLWNRVEGNSAWINTHSSLIVDFEKFKIQVSGEMERLGEDVDDVESAVRENTVVAREIKEQLTDLRISRAREDR